jgi:amino acid adenylation domain-containing protein
MKDSAPTMTEKLDQLQARSNLTRRQLLIWLGQQRYGDVPIYSTPFLWTFRGNLDPEVLQAAFQQVVDAHEALRTVIDAESGVPQSRIVPEMKVLMELVDLTNQADSQTALKEWTRQRLQKSFQLDEGLFETAFLKLKEGCVWFLNEHHLITDGRSKQLVFQKTAEAYEKISGVVNADLAESIQFSEFVEFERRSKEKRSANRAQQYWSEFLNSNPPCEVFPPSSGTSTEGLRLSRELDASNVSRIRSSGGAEGNLTLVGTMITVLLTLLYCRTGRTQLTIGHTLSNRPSPRHQEMLGLCLEIAPLAVTIEEGETFQSLRLKVLKGIFEGMRFIQHLPWNHPGRPVYDVLFNYLNPQFGNFHGIEADCEWLYPGHQEDALELQVQEFRDENGMLVTFDFRNDAVNESERGPLMSQFFSVLDSLLENSSGRLDKISLLTASEREFVLNKWSRGEPVERSDAPDLATRFERQVDRTPDACALVSENTRWTYGELNERANQIAHSLLSLGVEIESPVGICLERSPDMLAAILGVLKAGGAYVPLSTEDPPQRIKGMIQTCGSVHLISSIDQIDRLDKLDNVSVLNLDNPLPENNRVSNPSVTLTPDNLAYIIHTSGSTGRPKGVAIEHRGVLTLIDWAEAYFDRDVFSGMLFSTSICFDLSVFEIFVTLSLGGRLITVKDGLSIFDGESSDEVTFINTVPSIMRELIYSNHTLESIRVVGLCGEPLNASLVNACYKIPTVTEVYNFYGPTEETVYSTYNRVPRDTNDPVLIGRPVSGTNTYVLNQNLEPVPPGIVGELFLGGGSLARGYHNQPELTADAFISNSLPEESGETLYKTGDLSRWTTDGKLEFLGRRDHQVKIRGFRIELSEIEAVISENSSIQNCVVVTRDQKNINAQLIAYIAPGNVEAEEIRHFLSERLPAYMVPVIIMPIESIPLNANGKIDRRALPTPPETVASSSNPQTPTERMLADIFQNLFQMPQVGNEDDFFELGGDSIIGTRMLNKIEEQMGVRLTLRDLFDHSTIRALAKMIANSQA